MRSRAGLAELRPADLECRAVLGLQRNEGRIARVDHLARVSVHLDCIARAQPLGGRYLLQFDVGHASIRCKRRTMTISDGPDHTGYQSVVCHFGLHLEVFTWPC